MIQTICCRAASLMSKQVCEPPRLSSSAGRQALNMTAKHSQICGKMKLAKLCSVSIVALRIIYPPCRQRLPHQACSNHDEIWGRASSLGQQHEEGRVAGAASGRWAHQALNVSSTF